VSEVGVQYLPVHGRYIAIFTYNPTSNKATPSFDNSNTVWQVYEAGTLTGPWTKIQTMVWKPGGYYTPYFMPASLNTDGGLTGTILAAGNYSNINSAGGLYTMNMFPVTFNYTNP
jgi:hypothetical protein